MKGVHTKPNMPIYFNLPVCLIFTGAVLHEP